MWWGLPDATWAFVPGGEVLTGEPVHGCRRRFPTSSTGKELIIASGCEIWALEVEDVLYSHDSVREAAVVGVLDAYRRETVQGAAFLRPGAGVTENELVKF